MIQNKTKRLFTWKLQQEHVFFSKQILHNRANKAPATETASLVKKDNYQIKLHENNMVTFHKSKLHLIPGIITTAIDRVWVKKK